MLAPMHEWEFTATDKPGPRKPFRSGATKPRDRKRLADCDYGDVVEFVNGPPECRVCGHWARAPFARARVSFFLAGAPFVRFLDADGRSATEVSYVCPSTPIALLGTAR